MTTVEEIVINLRVQAFGIKQELNKQSAWLKRNYSELGAVNVAKLNTQLEKLETNIKKTSGNTPFAGWAMSIMFFGMALQRMFSTIWKEGTKTFQDIMHSVEGTTTQFDVLQGAMTFLKFSIGEALEPLAAAVLPIVERLSEWVSKNEEVVRGVTAAFGVGGTVLAIFGAAILAKNGIVDMLARIPSGLNDIKNYDYSSIGTKMNAALGSLSFILTFKAAYDTITSDTVGEGIVNGLKTGAFAGAFITTGLARGVLFAVGVGLELVDTGKFFKVLGGLMNPITSYFKTVGEFIEETLQRSIRHGLYDTFASTLIDIVTLIPAGFGELLGFDVKSLKESLKKAIGASTNTAEAFDFFEEYKKNLKEIAAANRELDIKLTNFINYGEWATKTTEDINQMSTASISSLNAASLYLDELKNVLTLNKNALGYTEAGLISRLQESDVSEQTIINVYLESGKYEGVTQQTTIEELLSIIKQYK